MHIQYGSVEHSFHHPSAHVAAWPQDSQCAQWPPGNMEVVGGDMRRQEDTRPSYLVFFPPGQTCLLQPGRHLPGLASARRKEVRSCGGQLAPAGSWPAASSCEQHFLVSGRGPPALGCPPPAPVNTSPGPGAATPCRHPAPPSPCRCPGPSPRPGSSPSSPAAARCSGDPTGEL